ncbi:MAG: hypothetical protein ABH873_07830 [Candidatus Firestonebacteria bacterium]
MKKFMILSFILLFAITFAAEKNNTYLGFDKIKLGMSYEQVDNIINTGDIKYKAFKDSKLYLNPEYKRQIEGIISFVTTFSKDKYIGKVITLNKIDFNITFFFCNKVLFCLVIVSMPHKANYNQFSDIINIMESFNGKPYERPMKPAIDNPGLCNCKWKKGEQRISMEYVHFIGNNANNIKDIFKEELIYIKISDYNLKPKGMYPF